MKFTKMHGIGNDYVYVNCFEEEVKDPAAVSVAVSDRHFGIGSDGLILIKPSDRADAEMDIYNADGSRAMMCGNGIRCVGKYIYDHNIAKKDVLTIDTQSGVKTLKVKAEKGKAAALTVDMGRPVPGTVKEKILVDGKEWAFTFVSMGNPHAVVFVEDPGKMDLPAIGPRFEFHERFAPDRVNTEFVQVIDRGHVRMRVWERGSGETMACGTGACAVAVASILGGYTDNTVEVELLGGKLIITWDREKDTVFMTGPAAEVFSGEIELSGK